MVERRTLLFLCAIATASTSPSPPTHEFVINIVEGSYLSDVSWTFGSEDPPINSGTYGTGSIISLEEGSTTDLIMNDSYGDGWTGNKFQLLKDGEAVFEATLESGSTGTASFTVPYYSVSPSPPPPSQPPLSPPSPSPPPVSCSGDTLDYWSTVFDEPPTMVWNTARDASAFLNANQVYFLDPLPQDGDVVNFTWFYTIRSRLTYAAANGQTDAGNSFRERQAMWGAFFKGHCGAVDEMFRLSNDALTGPAFYSPALTIEQIHNPKDPRFNITYNFQSAYANIGMGIMSQPYPTAPYWNFTLNEAYKTKTMYEVCCETLGGPPLASRVESACACKDPHIVLAYGGAADFRGKNDTVYNYITSPHTVVNARTADARYTLQGNTIEGSFVTQVHIRARLPGGLGECNATISAHSLNDRNYAWDFVKGVCKAAPQLACKARFTLGPHSAYACGAFKVQVDYSTAYVQTVEWGVVASGMPVYDRLAGAHHRLDVTFQPDEYRSPVKRSYGIVGASYDGSGIARHGREDAYPAPHSLKAGEVFRTSAMAEGAIDGDLADYEMASPFDAYRPTTRTKAVAAARRLSEDPPFTLCANGTVTATSSKALAATDLCAEVGRTMSDHWATAMSYADTLRLFEQFVPSYFEDQTARVNGNALCSMKLEDVFEYSVMGLDVHCLPRNDLNMSEPLKVHCPSQCEARKPVAQDYGQMCCAKCHRSGFLQCDMSPSPPPPPSPPPVECDDAYKLQVTLFNGNATGFGTTRVNVYVNHALTETISVPSTVTVVYQTNSSCVGWGDHFSFTVGNYDCECQNLAIAEVTWNGHKLVGGPNSMCYMDRGLKLLPSSSDNFNVTDRLPFGCTLDPNASVWQPPPPLPPPSPPLPPPTTEGDIVLVASSYGVSQEAALAELQKLHVFAEPAFALGRKRASVLDRWFVVKTDAMQGDHVAQQLRASSLIKTASVAKRGLPPMPIMMEKVQPQHQQKHRALSAKTPRQHKRRSLASTTPSLTTASRRRGLKTTAEYVRERQPYLDVLGLAGPSPTGSLTVAVVDDSWRLSALSSMFASLFTNEGDDCGNGKDDDDNGIIDDCHGISETSDASFHGHQVSSVMFATAKDDTGFDGVLANSGAKLLPVSAGFYTVTFLTRIAYAVNMGAKLVVTALSFPGERSESEIALGVEFMNDLESLGVVVVNALNNDAKFPEKFEFLTSLPHVVNVAGVDRHGNVALQSSQSPYATVAATFYKVWTEYPNVESGYVTSSSGATLDFMSRTLTGYMLEVGDGNSFAAPLVGGLMGRLMLEFPNLTPAEYRACLVDGASPFASSVVPAGAVLAQGFGAGLANYTRARELCAAKSAAAPPAASPPPPPPTSPPPAGVPAGSCTSLGLSEWSDFQQITASLAAARSVQKYGVGGVSKSQAFFEFKAWTLCYNATGAVAVDADANEKPLVFSELAPDVQCALKAANLSFVPSETCTVTSEAPTYVSPKVVGTGFEDPQDALMRIVHIANEDYKTFVKHKLFPHRSCAALMQATRTSCDQHVYVMLSRLEDEGVAYDGVYLDYSDNTSWTAKMSEIARLDYTMASVCPNFCASDCKYVPIVNTEAHDVTRDLARTSTPYKGVLPRMDGLLDSTGYHRYGTTKDACDSSRGYESPFTDPHHAVLTGASCGSCGSIPCEYAMSVVEVSQLWMFELCSTSCRACDFGVVVPADTSPPPPSGALNRGGPTQNLTNYSNPAIFNEGHGILTLQLSKDPVGAEHTGWGDFFIDVKVVGGDGNAYVYEALMTTPDLIVDLFRPLEALTLRAGSENKTVVGGVANVQPHGFEFVVRRPAISGDFTSIQLDATFTQSDGTEYTFSASNPANLSVGEVWGGAWILPWSWNLVRVTADAYPHEVYWYVTCGGSKVLEAGNSSAGGGAPFEGMFVNARYGENCTLTMGDTFQDGWSGAVWSFGEYSFSLASGGSETVSFVVPTPPDGQRPPLPPAPPPLPPFAPPSPPETPAACPATCKAGAGPKTCQENIELYFDQGVTCRRMSELSAQDPDLYGDCPCTTGAPDYAPVPCCTDPPPPPSPPPFTCDAAATNGCITPEATGSFTCQFYVDYYYENTNLPMTQICNTLTNGQFQCHSCCFLNTLCEGVEDTSTVDENGYLVGGFHPKPDTYTYSWQQ